MCENGRGTSIRRFSGMALSCCAKASNLIILALEGFLVGKSNAYDPSSMLDAIYLLFEFKCPGFTIRWNICGRDHAVENEVPKPG